MRGVVETAVFVGLAAAAHAAVIVAVAESLPGVPPTAGAGGESGITLAALPGLAEAVADWDTAPSATTETPMRQAAPAQTLAEAPGIVADAPAPSAAPAMPRTDSPPDRAEIALPAALTVRPELQAILPAPPAPAVPLAEAPLALPAAEARPLSFGAGTRLAAMTPPGSTPAAPFPPEPFRALPDRATAAPLARPAFRAAGTGEGAVAGRAATTLLPEKASQDAVSSNPALIARWGAAIGARIEARKLSPRGDWAPGRAALRLVVARDGRVQSVSLVQSAGDPRLDKAALSAVQRAGRLPPAPEGFAAPTATFTLPASFTR
ncbi:cell envelope integrity protein TolA [Ovoidimarina sediminis]|uniref:cell envelope integrity protein TolA n=1 Tax=Ovoidimarina sediminis TaxID=3079856 RepID=UPI00290F9DBF|nr:cell envelope integrity protein TolA [Rhodophyticola sp. MJ-SS7]MDU8945144.1 cell envelope integrity protein TolA [Rhodophyticola sp. MJ-SS7]